MNKPKTHTAPYGFVPLSSVVVEPSWAQPRDREANEGVEPAELQDAPFEDAISGTIEVQLEAETDIFIRGSSDPERSFQLPNGEFAVPGASIRGALRNVVEIASFGRMRAVNDHRYSVRDLQNRHLYGQYMAEIMYNEHSGKREPMPLVNAGWLTREESDEGFAYSINVCDFAKIEYQTLEEFAKQSGVGRFNPGRKQSAVEKYRSWGSKSRDANFKVSFDRPNGQRLVSAFGKVHPRGVTQRKGTLVFTGQPSEYRRPRPGSRQRGKAKHHDFVFFDAYRPQKLEILPKVFSDFEFAHADGAQQHSLNRSRMPNEEWGYWKDKLKNGEQVPVFFIMDDDGRYVRAMGLAMMFRLAYRHSVGDAVKNAQGANQSVDFAEAIFGTVRNIDEDEKEAPTIAQRGRVSFSHAKASEAVREAGSVTTILGAPKASYYPNYVEQDPRNPGSGPEFVKGRPRYTTWQDDGVVPRGWKRYRTLTRTWKPKPPTGSGGRELDTSKVGTTFRPLAAGATFTFKIRMHNLRPCEAGALIWALTFGEDREARHSLGLARPLGYGRTVFRITGSSLTQRGEELGDVGTLQGAFVSYMTEQLASSRISWEDSVQIRELCALARPVEPDEAKYQILDPGRRINEFVDAKKEGSVLARAGEGGAHYSRSFKWQDDAPHPSARQQPEPRFVPTEPEPEKISKAEALRIRLIATLKPQNAQQKLPDAFDRADGDAKAERAVVEAAIEKLGEKWLKKKASQEKRWIMPLLPKFEEYQQNLRS